MGRWRPPAEKSTALITRDGHARLKAELMPYLYEAGRAAHERGLPVIYTTGMRRDDRWDTGSWSWKNPRVNEKPRTGEGQGQGDAGSAGSGVLAAPAVRVAAQCGNPYEVAAGDWRLCRHACEVLERLHVQQEDDRGDEQH